MNARWMQHCVAALIAASVIGLAPSAALAQDTLSKAKGFYESADYEAALQLLDSLKGKTSNTEAAAYRVFCLIALGRKDEARVAIESIVRTDPLYRPPAAQVPPRLRMFFDDIRKPLLPEIARQTYTSAKAAFDAKNWAPAVEDFDEVMSLLNEIGGSEPGVSDLRTLATGFRDLAKAAMAPPPPAPTPTPTPTPAPTPTPPPAPVVYGSEHTEVRRPVAISQHYPEWRPDSVAEQQMSYVGAIELVVSEQGKVLSVRLVENIHPRYNGVLLKAAESWTFKPAMKDGKPVRYRYVVAVQLGKSALDR
jgi:tetratricopeptide (TPR) repeat protein